MPTLTNELLGNLPKDYLWIENLSYCWRDWKDKDLEKLQDADISILKIENLTARQIERIAPFFPKKLNTLRLGYMFTFTCEMLARLFKEGKLKQVQSISYDLNFPIKAMVAFEQDTIKLVNAQQTGASSTKLLLGDKAYELKPALFNISDIREAFSRSANAKENFLLACKDYCFREQHSRAVNAFNLFQKSRTLAGYTMLAICYARGIGCKPDAVQALTCCDTLMTRYNSLWAAAHAASYYQHGVEKIEANPKLAKTAAAKVEKALNLPANSFLKGENKFVTALKAFWNIDTVNDLPQKDYSQLRANGTAYQYSVVLLVTALSFPQFPVAEDFMAAVKEVAKAAEEGNAFAKSLLVKLYFCGLGVPLDKAKAGQKALEILDSGEPEIERIIAEYYVDKEDFITAVSWYQKAGKLNQGSLDALLSLGKMYLYGIGVAENASEAMNYIRAAANREDPAAQYLLALCYENGIGVNKDYRQAVAWLEKAALQGYCSAQSLLGKLYKHGREGIGKSETIALTWFSEASQRGDLSALVELGYYNVSQDDQDAWNKGYQYLTIAASAPVEMAHAYLYLLAKRQCVAPPVLSLKIAIDTLRTLASNGDKNIQKILREDNISFEQNSLKRTASDALEGQPPAKKQRPGFGTNNATVFKQAAPALAAQETEEAQDKFPASDGMKLR